MKTPAACIAEKNASQQIQNSLKPLTNVQSGVLLVLGYCQPLPGLVAAFQRSEKMQSGFVRSNRACSSLRPSTRQKLILVAVSALPLVASRFADAATARSYTGAAGGDFSTITNYSGSTVAANDNLIFNKAGLGTLINTVATPLTLSGVAFDTNVGSLTIGSATGTGFTLSNAGTISTLATLLAGTYTDTLNTPITLAPASTTTGGAGSFLSNGTSGQTLVIGGPITTGATTGTITLNLGGTNTTGNLISGGITPSNTGLFVISKTGAGYWTDSATNNFSGTIQVSAGQLTLSGVDNSTTASTASASTVSGGTLILSGTTTVGSLNLSGGYILASGTNTFSGIGSFSGGSFSSTGNATFSSTSATALTITNSIFNASSTTSFAGGVTVTTGGSLTLSGPVSGAGSFTITNNGSATLSGTNTFTGAINLTGGTLTLSGVDTAAGTTTVSGNTANSPYIQPLLTLDFTAGQASILKTTSAFVLGDGVVAIRGTGTQAVAGLTLNGATAGTLSLGTGTLTATGITRNSESTLFVDESLAGPLRLAQRQPFWGISPSKMQMASD